MASTTKKTVQTFLVRDPETGSLSVLGTGKQKFTTQPPSVRALRSAGSKKHVVILGGGIAGLTAAYDLLKNNYQVTLIEANKRLGGRSLTLRDKDTFTEEYGTKKWTQKCELKTAADAPYKAYLNAGPGRIPSAHYHVLNLCKELKVDLEVYIMQSRSNLIRGNASQGTMINRRVANDTIGYIAADLYQYLKRSTVPNKQAYMELLIQAGALKTVKNERGQVTDATYEGSNRSGYEELPGIEQGKPVKAIEKDVLLNSKFWENHFYQPEDFLWQSTSFQPVGGMDMIEQKIREKFNEERFKGKIEVIMESPVTRIERAGKGWKVYHVKGRQQPVEADICLSNIPIPLLKGKLTERDFRKDFWKDFLTVADSEKFLASTCKVGWQAQRELWQKMPDKPFPNPVIPIFGGISYTSHPITQMWYPSDRFHDELGVLTGAYNYTKNAQDWGKLPPERRLAIAREGAKQLHGNAFAEGLKSGITIAWQNIATQKGGWADWSEVDVRYIEDPRKWPEERVRIFNNIRNGDIDFYVIGDQVSWLPGWKEGAVAVAQEVVAKVMKFPDFEMLQIQQLPDTRSLIEGHEF